MKNKKDPVKIKKTSIKKVYLINDCNSLMMKYGQEICASDFFYTVLSFYITECGIHYEDQEEFRKLIEICVKDALETIEEYKNGKI